MEWYQVHGFSRSQRLPVQCSLLPISSLCCDRYLLMGGHFQGTAHSAMSTWAAAWQKGAWQSCAGGWSPSRMFAPEGAACVWFHLSAVKPGSRQREEAGYNQASHNPLTTARLGGGAGCEVWITRLLHYVEPSQRLRAIHRPKRHGAWEGWGPQERQVNAAPPHRHPSST